MSAKTSRCGASLPDQDAEEDQHYCRHPVGHMGWHEDDKRIWSDMDVVEVKTVKKLRAVPHHAHNFQGDESTCEVQQRCPLTWGEFKTQQRDWETQQEAPGEDEESKPVEVSQERLEDAVDRMKVMLALSPSEPVPTPQKPLQDVCRVLGCGHREDEHESRRGHCQGCHTETPDDRKCLHFFFGPVPSVEPPAPRGPSAALVIVDEVASLPDSVEPEIPQAPQNSPDDDVCFCGCAHKEHRDSLLWGVVCDGCIQKGPRSTYQWRHPFSRDVGRIRSRRSVPSRLPYEEER